MNVHHKISFVFFGSSSFSVFVLEELAKAGFVPKVIITTPDKPRGRGLVLSPTPVKHWAIEKNIPFYAQEKLDSQFAEKLKKENCDVFVVASYGKIIPSIILDIPPKKTLNVHPSLLPKFRGASPLQSAMLEDAKNTGVTIMRINEKMDEGPVVAQKEIVISEWPVYEVFEEDMARAGGVLLSDILLEWVEGKITEKPQNHSLATYTKKITKADGLIDMSADPYTNFRKIQAFHIWPGAYFFAERGGEKIRVKITSASFKDGILTIKRVTPAGGRDMDYKDFISPKATNHASSL